MAAGSRDGRREEENMRGFGLNSWTTGDRVSLRDDLRVASAAGYRFVEVRDAKIEKHLKEGGSLAELRELAKEGGVRILSVNTLEDSTYARGARREQLVARCECLAMWAEALDCPYLILGPSYRHNAGEVLPDVREHAVAALSTYAATAAEHGRRIAFEFHGYARCTVNRLDHACAILDDLGDPSVGLVIDAFHFYVGGSRLAELSALDPARLLIVHLADVDHADLSRLGKANRVMPGDGVLPLRDFVDAIRRTGFEGPYSLELFREEYWVMDPFRIAKLGIERMQRFA
jgi:2-keto-myo-inositol isomerase